MADSEMSVNSVVIFLLVTVTIFGWGFMAGSYTGAQNAITGENHDLPERPQRLGRRGSGGLLVAGVVTFVKNSLVQLPNCGNVIVWHLRNRIWLPIVILVIEGLTIAAGVKMKALEKEMKRSRSPRSSIV